MNTPAVPRAPLDGGLTAADVDARRREFGFNEIVERKTSPLVRFVLKFWGLSAWMLETIALLAWWAGRYSDVIVSGSLLVLNAVVSFTQEQRAEGVVDTLRRRSTVRARVLREGHWQIVAARELVPGDVVRLRPGDLAPADIEVADGTVTVDQSILTGESLDVQKAPASTVHSGSTVRRGEATGVVTQTGAQTYFGKTVELVQIAKPRLHIEEIVATLVVCRQDRHDYTESAAGDWRASESGISAIRRPAHRIMGFPGGRSGSDRFGRAGHSPRRAGARGPSCEPRCINKVSRTILKSAFVAGAFLVTGQFVISALAMILVVFLTDFVKIALATDRAQGTDRPETWNLAVPVKVGVITGLLLLVESGAALWLGWHVFDLGLYERTLHTFSFQLLLYFALFSIVSARERRRFWASRPSRTLAAALIADAIVGFVLCRVGIPGLAPVSIDLTAFVVLSAAVASLVINDWVKAMLFRRAAVLV